jgi:hypothetical protein
MDSLKIYRRKAGIPYLSSEAVRVDFFEAVGIADMPLM